VVLDRLGVVNDVPVPWLVPPEETVYQFRVPTLAVAPKLTGPASQREAGIVEAILGVAIIVAVTAVLGVLSQELEFTATT
jgi:hypothetical protein